MEDQVKRLFIGGLPSSTTDSEIRTMFGRFGDISDVDLAKKDSVSGKLEHCFAHFNFHGNEQQCKKLVSTFNKTRWKGKTLKIETAKENFLDRLAKEKLAGPKETIDAPQTRRDLFLENLKKAGVTNFTMKKAVPGTGIAGEKNWVVCKYGRVMPVVYLRTKDKRKVMKIDPSKYIHNVKQIRDGKKHESDKKDGTHQAWREQNTPSYERNKWLPQEHKAGGVVHSVRRKQEVGHNKDQWSETVEGHNRHTFAVSTIEKDVDEVGGFISKQHASVKKYIRNGSSPEESGEIDGGLKRKARYDRDLENADSKVMKTKKHQVSAMKKSDSLSGSFNAEVKGHRADGIETEKYVKGDLAKFVKIKDKSEAADSYLFNFFDNDRDSSSSEIEQEVGTYGYKSDDVVDESEPSSTDESINRSSHLDLKVKIRIEEKTEVKDVKVEREYNSAKSSSVLAEHGDSVLATSPEVAKATVVATFEEERDSEHGLLEGNKSSLMRTEEPVKEVLDSEDLISSIINEMKLKDITQSSEEDSRIIGGGVDEEVRTESGEAEKRQFLDDPDRDENSKSLILQTANLNKPGLSETERSKEIILNFADEDDKTLTSRASETPIRNGNRELQLKRNFVAAFKGIGLLQGKLATNGFEDARGLASEKEKNREDAKNVSEIDAGHSFKSNLMSLSSRKQSDSESSNSDADESDEEELELDEKREDGVTKEIGKDSDRGSDENCGEEVDDSGRLLENTRRTERGREEERKSLETSNDEENSRRDERNMRKDGDVEKCDEKMPSLQESNLTSDEIFQPLVLDREVLRGQGLVQEHESDAREAEDDEESGGSDEDDSSSCDEKAGPSRKRKKQKFVFQEFKGMNRFRKELQETKSCAGEAREPFASKDGEDDRMEREKTEEASSSDDDGQSAAREISTRRITGSVKDLGSQSENESTILEEKGGVERKGCENRQSKKVKKGGKVKNVGRGESKSCPKTKNLREMDSVEVGAVNERNDLDADDESSSTESSINGKKKKKKKKCKKSKDVSEKRELVKGENEEEIMEDSLSLISKVLEKSGVVEDSTKRDKEKKVKKIDKDDENIGSYIHDRRKGFVEKIEEGKESLLENEGGEDIKERKRAKTSFLKEENRKSSTSFKSEEKILSENQRAADVPMKPTGANFERMTKVTRAKLENMVEISNQKRIQAVKERQAELKQKQTAIQQSLAAVDLKEKSNDKNHRRFESSGEGDSDTEEGEQRDTKEQKEPKEKSMTLFDDDYDEDNSTSDDERFQLKPQFEGEQGTKLLKLQDKFGDDQRFKLDKRFAEDDNDNDNRNDGVEEEAVVDPEAVDLDAEKVRSLAILENVLGILLPRNNDIDDKKLQFRDVNYLHFDPTREDHSKFVLKMDDDSKPGKKRKRGKRNKRRDGDEDDADNPLPAVSKELFSEVTTDLKSAFSQEGPASFSFFKDDNDVIGMEEKPINQDEEQAVPLTDPLFDKKKLPWDSSDSEEETEAPVEHGSTETIKPETTEEPKTYIAESFFFAKGDNRLQGVGDQFCRGKDAEVTEVWNNAKQQMLRAGSKRHQKALRDGQMNTRRGRLSNFKRKSPGGKS